MNWESEYLYLILMGLTLLGPLVQSFESRVAYYKSFRALGLAIFLPMILFIPWDAAFTHFEIWGFNESYILGIELFGLPLEEWLFFVAVPFSCVFIYRVLNFYFPKPWITEGQASMITQYLAWLSISVVIFSWGKWYTVSVFSLVAFLMISLMYWVKVSWLPAFYQAFVIILIPFFIVNGILTGSFIESEVVWYNNAHNLGYRIATIPLEDIFYAFTLLLLNVGFYEYYNKKNEATS